MIAAVLACVATPSFASLSEEDEGFQGWVKTYCVGSQTSDPTIVEYGSCSIDSTHYHVAAPGVRYKTLRKGFGSAAQNGDVVVVEYLGWVYDKEAAYARGAIVDTSYTFDRRPFEFALRDNRIIPGWAHGIRGMKRGEIREIVIDSEMAYGDRAVGDRIPPCSTLIFEIELLEFRSAD